MQSNAGSWRGHGRHVHVIQFHSALAPLKNLSSWNATSCDAETVVRGQTADAADGWHSHAAGSACGYDSRFATVHASNARSCKPLASGCVCVPETPLMMVIGQFAQFTLDGTCRSSEDMDAFHESSDLMEGT